MQTSSQWITPSHPGVYDEIGPGYVLHRRPDRRIASQLEDALGPARIICNVGAGTGAYEPTERSVFALEPSREMISQRSPGALPNTLRGIAEHLPFRDDAFDASMAILTVHHWLDVDAGLAEMRRVAPRRIVLTFDLERSMNFWLVQEYIPGLATLKSQVPSVERIAAGIDATRVETIWVPHDCTDGFLAAYWRRPERYLDPNVRGCISALAQFDQTIVESGIDKLARDLETGVWHERHADDLARDVMDWGYRLVICDPEE
jgi:SAM-dependent methyltransferase